MHLILLFLCVHLFLQKNKIIKTLLNNPQFLLKLVMLKDYVERTLFYGSDAILQNFYILFAIGIRVKYDNKEELIKMWRYHENNLLYENRITLTNIIATYIENKNDLHMLTNQKFYTLCKLVLAKQKINKNKIIIQVEGIDFICV